MVKKNIVAGLGEIGGPILKLISKHCTAAGYDSNPKLSDRHLDRYGDLETEMLHVCIPFSEFERNVCALFERFRPGLVVIHSTIPPDTTAKLQKMLPVPIIYSPVRGVHSRMLKDLKRYTKYFALEADAPRSRWAASAFSRLMGSCGIKTERMSKPVALELAKIVVDTSYYGWLINYAQLSKMIADKHGVDYDEMWKFADEIQKYLGNRPKMFPGIIGGHCLDADELVFIDTRKGMKPVTIKSYVESKCKDDVLSFDLKSKKPVFVEVTSKHSRQFSGTVVTLTSETGSTINSTDRHIMITDALSEKLAKDVKVGDKIPFLASLPKKSIQEHLNFYFDKRKEKCMPESIGFSPMFCRLLGYYLFCGSKELTYTGRLVRFRFKPGSAESAADVYGILQSLGIKYRTFTEDITYVDIDSTSFSYVITDILGCGSGRETKYLPDFIYFAPKSHKEEFLRGYLGRHDYASVPALPKTRNKILIAGLEILLLSVGYIRRSDNTIQAINTENRATDGMPDQALDGPAPGPQESARMQEPLCMVKTSKVEHREESLTVYSIDTENHLFVSTGGRLVHNCVIPNLELADEESLFEIGRINRMFAEKNKK